MLTTDTPDWALHAKSPLAYGLVLVSLTWTVDIGAALKFVLANRSRLNWLALLSRLAVWHEATRRHKRDDSSVPPVRYLHVMEFLPS